MIICSAKGSCISINDNTIIAANTYIIDCNHRTSRDSLIQTQGFEFHPLIIGSDVWIGASCVIGKGAKLGKGAVVGANSFVNKPVEEYEIVAGSPAHHIGYRE